MKSLTPFLLLTFLSIQTFAQTELKEDLESESLELISVSDIENIIASDLYDLKQSRNDIKYFSRSWKLSHSRFDSKGYERRYVGYTLNSLDISDLSSGDYPLYVYSPWLRYGSSDENFSSTLSGNPILGISNRDIAIRADKMDKTNRISYQLSDKSPGNRIHVFSSSSIEKTDYALGADVKTGDDRFIDGVFSEGFNALASLSRRFNRTTLYATLIAEKNDFGLRTAATAEAFKLTGNNYYNPSVGSYDNKDYNSKILKNNIIHVIGGLNHVINENITLNIDASFTNREYNKTAIEWHDVMNPYPDYYRYMPSYFLDNLGYYEVRDEWIENPEKQKIDFLRMVRMNKENSDEGDYRAKYILASRVAEDRDMAGRASIIIKGTENLTHSISASIRNNSSDNYKVINDLLGANYWLNNDQFIDEILLGQEYADNNLNDPNKRMYKNERYGYSYKIYNQTAKLYYALGYNFAPMRVNLYADMAQHSIYRDGIYRKGNFKNNSFGKSDKISLIGINIAGTFTFDLSGSSSLSLHGSSIKRPPLAKNIFIAPESNNHLTDAVDSEQISDIKLNYLLNTPELYLKVAVSKSKFSSGMEIRRFYDQISRNFTDMVTRSIDKNLESVQIDAAYTPTENLTLSVYATAQNYIFSNNAVSDIIIESTAYSLTKNAVVPIKGYRIGNIPQYAVLGSVTYRLPYRFTISLSSNCIAGRYVDINPARRMERVTSRLRTENAKNAVEKQEMLPDIMSFDAYIGKTFSFKNRISMNLSLQVNNIAGNKDFIKQGYEQMRIIPDSVNGYISLANKYLYDYPMNYRFQASMYF